MDVLPDATYGSRGAFQPQHPGGRRCSLACRSAGTTRQDDQEQDLSTAESQLAWGLLTGRAIRVLATETLDVKWIRMRQLPGVSPPQSESETLTMRYTAPPDATWQARVENSPPVEAELASALPARETAK